MVDTYVLPPVLSSFALEYISTHDHQHLLGNMNDSEKCKYAAKNGYLELLIYFHENGCPWDESTCYVAAQYDHLGCLKYAHENGCPWDEDTCYSGNLVSEVRP
jgi:hypothetical protein